jgi:hypothetical protein
MSVEKSLYTAPAGLGDLEELSQEPDIEVEIVDPEEVTITAGGLEITIDPDAEVEFDNNLAEEVDENALVLLASDLAADIENDLAARKDWETMYKDGITLLGLKFEERTEPWEGACGVFHPMITEAVVRFQSETIMETFPAKGPVKTQIIGKETPEKKDAATRIQEDMNYQLTERCRSSEASMSGCCGTCPVQVARLRRCTTTRTWSVKFLCLFRQKTLSCPTVCQT